MDQNTLYVFGDIHGDFNVLQDLLTKVLKVAKFEKNIWTWIAKKTTVVCLGDFLDRYRVKNEYTLTTDDTIKAEHNIINCFKSLQEQAKPEKNDCAFIVLLGNHELASILQIPDYFKYQVENPDDVEERSRRVMFLRDHFLEFAESCGLAVQWGNYYMCHGGFDLKWLQRHKFKSLVEINKRFKDILISKRPDRLSIFLEDDSIVLSRKMAFHTKEWRESDKSAIARILGEELVPKFIVGHTTVHDILQFSLTDVSVPQCDENSKTSILAVKDYFGQDDIYFVDVAMSRGFLPMEATDRDKFLRRPQALKFTIKLDDNFNILYSNCETLG